MKKYKLKKDFPGSKIGDVWVKADSGFMSPEDRETIKMHEHLFKPFNDWFEDYEEPKEYWFLSTGGEPHRFDGEDEIFTPNRKSIGNYFDTREEAEKAVEKIKAWKRLKDKGFRFTGIAGISNNISFEADNKYNAGHIMFDEYSNTDDKLKEYNDDLMLLFRSEE